MIFLNFFSFPLPYRAKHYIYSFPLPYRAKHYICSFPLPYRAKHYIFSFPLPYRAKHYICSVRCTLFTPSIKAPRERPDVSICLMDNAKGATRCKHLSDGRCILSICQQSDPNLTLKSIYPINPTYTVHRRTFHVCPTTTCILV